VASPAGARDGANATLLVNALGDGTTLATASVTGTHDRAVGARQYPAGVGFGAAPSAPFGAAPRTINSGQTSTLSWITGAGAFIAGGIDQGIGAFSGGTGSVGVTPQASTTYSFIDVTDTGGAPGEATVMVSGAGPVINSFATNNALVNPGTAATLTWSTSGATSASLNGGS